jgi:site-specific DNA-methyltransferase (adenine-specific)
VKDGKMGKLTDSKEKKVFEYNDNGTRYPTQVLKFKRDCLVSNLHPTQKPVALLEYLIRTYTNEGETVLDNTMGSGTTGVACVNTNRNFIGIEKDEVYSEIARNRIDLATNGNGQTKQHNILE